jgi:hypothetical protein
MCVPQAPTQPLKQSPARYGDDIGETHEHVINLLMAVYSSDTSATRSSAPSAAVMPLKTALGRLAIAPKNSYRPCRAARPPPYGKRRHCSLVSILVLEREDDHRGDWSGTSAGDCEDDSS